MSSFADPAFLEGQYRDDSNLRARIELHRRFSTNPEPWHRWVFDRLDLPADADVLEVGCGPAELWRENRERIQPGWRLLLVDLSPGMLETARTELGERAEYLAADVQELPLPDGAFDAAIANHMLYHVADRERALAELARVLRPGGRIVAATNGRDHLRELHDGEPSWSTAFRLEDAAAELAPLFEDVRVELYRSSLDVTELEPLIAYLRSVDSTDLDVVVERAREAIGRDGVFRVSTSSGLVSGRKP